jgi:hypothetical protein
MRYGIPALITVFVSLGGESTASGQETVMVSVPQGIFHHVTNVNAVTTSNTVSVSFQNAKLSAGRALRISVRAKTSHMNGRSRATIPCSKFSWTATGASGGMGFSGTLVDSSYAVVYQSVVNPTAGSVDLSWRLASPGPSLRAEAQTLDLEWRIESVGP